MFVSPPPSILRRSGSSGGNVPGSATAAAGAATHGSMTAPLPLPGGSSASVKHGKGDASKRVPGGSSSAKKAKGSGEPHEGGASRRGSSRAQLFTFDAVPVPTTMPQVQYPSSSPSRTSVLVLMRCAAQHSQLRGQHCWFVGLYHTRSVKSRGVLP